MIVPVIVQLPTPPVIELPVALPVFELPVHEPPVIELPVVEPTLIQFPPITTRGS